MEGMHVHWLQKGELGKTSLALNVPSSSQAKMAGVDVIILQRLHTHGQQKALCPCQFAQSPAPISHTCSSDATVTAMLLHFFHRHQPKGPYKDVLIDTCMHVFAALPALHRKGRV